MPLIRLPADEAIQNRKNNPFAGWGDRGAPNRIEPVTAPGFDVPFRLLPGEPIFTIGSCFARNVERELLRRGFGIPARAIFTLPEFKDIEVGVINNYGTPSIFNEIAWAFEERPFVPEDHIVEIAPGKFVDQHIMPRLRPDSWERVLARRSAITRSYRSANECRVIIVTLGLSEVWYDTKSEFYLNVSPRPAMIRQFPRRYELHVLAYEEVFTFLLESLLLLQKHGHPELRVLLTVSPVPLGSTHRAIDVVVANTYSKAVLRTATEAVIAKLPFVTYYPSYESVILSDRKVAWLDDMVHVSDALVQLNVERMVDAYAGRATSEHTGAEISNELDAISGARAARIAGKEAATSFFAAHAEWCSKSTPFAIESARFMLDQKKPDEALEILARQPAADGTAIAALRCEALLAAGRTDEALAVLDQLGGRHVKSVALWDTIFKAALATGSSELVISVLNRLIANVRARAPHALFLAARFFREHGELETAIRYYRHSKDLEDRSITALELADVLIAACRPNDAREAIEGVEGKNAGEIARLQQLRALVG